MELAEEAIETQTEAANHENEQDFNKNEKISNEEPMSSSSSDGSNEDVSGMLAQGLLNIYQPPLVSVKANLSDLVNKQETVLKEMLKQRERISECNDSKEIKDMMQKLVVYKDKMRKIRSDMLYISKRTQEIKNKAIKIQEYKVEQKAKKVQQIHYEQTLIAASSSSKTKKLTEDT